MVNRILSSHSDFRVPIISGIVKIRALGESFFQFNPFQPKFSVQHNQIYGLPANPLPAPPLVQHKTVQHTRELPTFIRVVAMGLRSLLTGDVKCRSTGFS